MKSAVDKSALNPLVDCDFACYRSGFAADTQAKERWGADGYLEEDYLAWAIGNVNTLLDHLLSETFKNAEWHRIYIGGSGNYRDTIASTLPRVIEGWKYKGNRDALHKPKYFAEIREHLIKRWNAVLVEGRESDDEVSITQFGFPCRSTCIVTQDKDLLGSPGWHYNPVKKEFKYVTLREADLFFWSQVSTGDTADHIPGLRDIGPKKTEKMFKECDYAVPEIKRQLGKLYTEQYGTLGKAVMHDNCNLLWIQREDGVLYDGGRYGE